MLFYNTICLKSLYSPEKCKPLLKNSIRDKPYKVNKLIIQVSWKRVFQYNNMTYSDFNLKFF